MTTGHLGLIILGAILLQLLPVVFIGDGIGITPMRSWLPATVCCVYPCPGAT